LIPLYIGVTGHRDIPEEDVPGLEKKVASILAALREKYPDTPLTVLSPLAEGADRLVAKTGLRNGCRLIAVLPLPAEEYAMDFSTETSKGEFSSFLDTSEAILEMPLIADSTPVTVKTNGEHRSRQYAVAGNYVAAHSQILIALWNGKDLHEAAGTSGIVRSRLSGNYDQSIVKHDLFDVPNSGPVHYIFTRRKLKDARITSPAAKPEAGDCLMDEKNGILYPALWKKDETNSADPASRIQDAELHYAGTLRKINAFNRDARLRCGPGAVDRSSQALISPKDQAGLPVALTKLLHLYACADSLAPQFEITTERALKVLLAGAVVSFSFLGIFSELLPATYVLALFPVILGLVYLYYRSVERQEIKDKYNDYRALAEALRVQLFWKLIGSREDVQDHYLRKYRGEMNWILHSVRNISLFSDGACAPVPEPARRKALELAMNNWVREQGKFFGRRVNEKKRNVNAQEKFTMRLFTAAMLLVLGIFLLKGISIFYFGNVENILGMEDVKDWTISSVMLVAVDILIAIGAARAAYVEKRGLSDEMKQYQRMDSLYRRAVGVIGQYIEKNDLETAEKLMIDLGREALTENGDWLLLQRSRPLEMPLEG